MTYDLSKLRLEVEATPTGLTNLVDNTNGVLGTNGWITPLPNTFMGNDTIVNPQGSLNFYNTANQAGYFYSKLLKMSGSYVGSKFDIISPLANTQYSAKVSYMFYDANQVYLSTSAQSQAYVPSGNSQTFTVPPVAIPANAAYARMRFDLTLITSYTGDGEFDFTRVMVATANTSAALSSYSFVDTVWTNILNESTTIDVTREALNVGTLSASIRSNTLDPSIGDALSTGKKLRLMVNVADKWQPMFTGKIANAVVSFGKGKAFGDTTARIDLSAVDATSKLANTLDARGVAVTDDLALLLEGADVPWNIKGYAGQIPTANVVANNENASVLDQIAITRDSRNAYAWTDRAGVMQIWEPAPKYLETFSGTTSWTGGTVTGGAYKVTSTGGPQYAISPKISVQTQRTYRVSVSLRADSAAPANLLVTASHRLSRTTDYLDTTEASRAITANSTPQVITADVAVSGNTYALGIQVFTNEGKTIYVDDVSVVPVGLDLSDAAGISYTDIDVSLDTSECINQLAIKYLHTDPVTKETSEVDYGPYSDLSSINKYGAQLSTMTISLPNENAADIQAFANRVLAANSVPRVKANSLSTKVDSTASLEALAVLDLYGAVKVTFGNRVAETYQATTLSHHISPGEWTVDLGFGSLDSVATPQVTPSPTVGVISTGWTYPTLTGGWANVPGNEVRYRLNSSGQLVIEGLVQSGTAGNTAFTLPVGLRPSRTKRPGIYVHPAKSGIATIGADGTVQPGGQSSYTYYSLDLTMDL